MSEPVEQINDVFVPTPKIKRKRKPMSDEAKAVLVERLRLGRLAKKKKKEENVTMEIDKSKPKVQAEVAAVAAVHKEIEKDVEIKTEPTILKEPSSNPEMEKLQQELNKMRLEKMELIEAKNEKKKAAIKKRKETIARKALAKKLAENPVAKPAPERKPTLPVIIEESRMQQQVDVKPRYSTFKKSVWASL